MDLLKKLHVNINPINQASIEVILRITRVCNEKCLFCNIEMSGELYDKNEIFEVIEYVKDNYKGKEIIFTLSGGEPTIHPNFIEIIEKIYSLNCKANVQTNGVIFSNESFLKKVIGKDISFFVSLHAHDRLLYKVITGTDLYDKAVIGIANLLDNFGNVTLNFVVNKVNYKFIEHYFKFLNDYFKNDKINLTISNMSGVRENQQYLLVKYSDVVRELNKAHKFIGNIQLSINAGSYCYMPFCVFKNLEFIDQNNLQKYGIGVDNEIGKSIVYKSDNCNNCQLSKMCIGVPTYYYSNFGDGEMIPIYTQA